MKEDGNTYNTAQGGYSAHTTRKRRRWIVMHITQWGENKRYTEPRRMKRRKAGGIRIL